MINQQAESRPECLTAEMLEYLDRLREDGTCNMFGAAPFVQLEFQISRQDAKDVLIYWMETFSTRHPKSYWLFTGGSNAQ